MTPAEIAQLFAEGQWEQIASQIDTGIDNPVSSRALVVFNPTSEPISGTAVFHVDMPWHKVRDLPEIHVSHLASGQLFISSVSQPSFTPSTGENQHRRIEFDIRFAVNDIPAHGWDTYIAEYTNSRNVETDSDFNQNPKLLVIETLRHVGILPTTWPGS